MKKFREEGPRTLHTTRRAATRAALSSVINLEPLEPRQLLAADLSATFLAAPVSALSGSNQGVTINVANNGDLTAKGSMSVAFYAAPDGDVFDPNTALLLGKFTKSVSIVPAGSLNLNYTLPISASLPADAYRLYAIVDADHKITESDENNNTAQSPALAIAQPNYNLVPTFDAKTVLLPAVQTGLNTNATVRVTVTNSSGATANLPSGQKVVVQVVARPVGALNKSQDVVLNRSVTNASVSALKPGKSITLSIPIHFPDTLATDDYDIVAIVDTSDQLAETDENDNETVFAHEMKVGPAFSDPTLIFNAGTVIPLAVVADGRKLPMKFDVSNLGNVKVPSGQTCSIAIFAHNLSTSTDTPLQTLTVSLTSLASGGKKTLSLSPIIPLNLATGAFEIRAVLSTTCTGDIPGNSSASCASPLIVGPAFYNLGVATPTTTFNPAVIQGTATSGSVSVNVRNLSNAILPPGALAHVFVALRPSGELTSAHDILIGSALNVAMTNLAVGSSKSIKVSCSIPALVAGNPINQDNYQIVVTVASSGITESTQTDNTAFGPTITIAPPFVDLAVVSATQTFRTPSPSGSTGIGNVILRNTGSVTVQGNITIRFFATPQGGAASFEIGSRTFSVSLAPGASTVPLSTALNLSSIPADGHLATASDIVARIDPGSLINDANLGNSQLFAGTVIISSQYVDLKITSATQPFGGTLNGNSTGSAHVQICNIGSGLSAGPVTISFYATGSGTLDGSEILLGSQITNVSLGSAQISPTTDVLLTLPDPLSQTTYKIVAKITSALTIDNNLNNNLTTILGTVTVLPV